jgi:Flp pilus assembly protein TadG
LAKETGSNIVMKLISDRRGVAALEMAFVMPFLLTVMFAICEFGLVFNQYLTLTNATVVGALQFANSVGVDSTPYTDAKSAIVTAAGFTPTTTTIAINGTLCTGDTACTTALTASANTGYVTVTTTYSCAALNIALSILPAGCTLTAKQTERLQ